MKDVCLLLRDIEQDIDKFGYLDTVGDTVSIDSRLLPPPSADILDAINNADIKSFDDVGSKSNARLQTHAYKILAHQ
jgi:hypothetical protein